MPFGVLERQGVAHLWALGRACSAWWDPIPRGGDCHQWCGYLQPPVGPTCRARGLGPHYCATCASIAGGSPPLQNMQIWRGFATVWGATSSGSGCRRRDLAGTLAKTSVATFHKQRSVPQRKQCPRTIFERTTKCKHYCCTGRALTKRCHTKTPATNSDRCFRFLLCTLDIMRIHRLSCMLSPFVMRVCLHRFSPVGWFTVVHSAICPLTLVGQVPEHNAGVNTLPTHHCSSLSSTVPTATHPTRHSPLHLRKCNPLAAWCV